MGKQRVIAYLRVSTQEQAQEGWSMGEQRRRLAAYSEGIGVDVVEYVEDGGYSGKDLDRPGIVKALAALDAGVADGIAVVRLDRLTRRLRDLSLLVDTYFASKYALLS